MLKLYKNTIIASIVTAVSFIVISMICEFIDFNHSDFIFTYSSGIACSLIVVIITTILQYIHEHKRVLQEYKTILNELITSLVVINLKKDDEHTDGYYKKIYERLERQFSEFTLCNMEFDWFSRKKQQLQFSVGNSCMKMYIDFQRQTDRSNRSNMYKSAIMSLIEHPELETLYISVKSFIKDENYIRIINILFNGLFDEDKEVSP